MSQHKRFDADEEEDDQFDQKNHVEEDEGEGGDGEVRSGFPFLNKFIN